MKALVVQKLKEKKGIELDPELIRLRERNSEKLTRVYREIPMISQQIFERRMMAIEQIPEPQVLGFKEIVLVIRIFDSEAFQLSERFEIVVNKESSLKDLATSINKHHPSIAIENMIACRILSIARFNPFSLLSEEVYFIKIEMV